MMIKSTWSQHGGRQEGTETYCSFSGIRTSGSCSRSDYSAAVVRLLCADRRSVDVSKKKQFCGFSLP